MFYNVSSRQPIRSCRRMKRVDVYFGGEKGRQRGLGSVRDMERSPSRSIGGSGGRRQQAGDLSLELTVDNVGCLMTTLCGLRARTALETLTKSIILVSAKYRSVAMQTKLYSLSYAGICEARDHPVSICEKRKSGVCRSDVCRRRVGGWGRQTAAGTFAPHLTCYSSK